MSYIRTKEHRELMSSLKKGKSYGDEWKRKISENHADVSGENNPMWGRKRSQKLKDAVSQANKGRVHTNYVKPMLGKKHTPETIEKMRLAQLGPKSNNWQGGKTHKHKLMRSTSRYRSWRTAVYERDDYTCVTCGVKGGRINADHIEPLSKNEEKAYDLDNGRTLCVECHKNTPTYGFKLMHQ